MSRELQALLLGLLNESMLLSDWARLVEQELSMAQYIEDRFKSAERSHRFTLALHAHENLHAVCRSMVGEIDSYDADSPQVLQVLSLELAALRRR